MSLEPWIATVYLSNGRHQFVNVMLGTEQAILDAAERRIRGGGYNGFSFRDLAEDVGVKSASVHYHFPTKTDLVVAVARRYSERFYEAVEALKSDGSSPIDAWRGVFREALRVDDQMCLCGVLGAETNGLPSEVANEARAFFTRGIEALSLELDEPSRAVEVFATLEGAMLLARSLGDVAIFDQATAHLG